MSAEAPQPLNGVEIALLSAQIVRSWGFAYGLWRLCRGRTTG